jgi:hypothetical protein
MRLRGVHLNDVSGEHILRLVGQREDRELDFKESLPTQQDSFLADVVALANTNGGVLAFGIEEELDEDGERTGTAGEIVGVSPETSIEKDIERLTDWLYGIEPRLATRQYDFRPVTIGEKVVLLMGIEPSALGPHRVATKRLHGFYVRGPNSNRAPDTVELRRMFLARTEWLERATSFHLRRIERVQSGHCLQYIPSTRGVFVHLLPLGRIDDVLLTQAMEDVLANALQPFGIYGVGDRFWCSDGFVKQTVVPQRVDAYALVLRCGGVEGFNHNSFLDDEAEGSGGPMEIYMGELTKHLERFASTYVPLMSSAFNLAPPYWFGASIFRFGEGTLAAKYGTTYRFWPNRAHLPPVLIESAEPADLRSSIQPMLDALWQHMNIARVPDGILK